MADPASDDVYVNQGTTGMESPQPMYKMLRETTPVLRTDGFVVLTRTADVEYCLHHPEIFSSGMEAVQIGNVRPMIPLQIDPPDHAKWRRILDPLFTPREVAKLEADVVRLVHELIDEFASRGECDFHEEFAVPLPCTVFLKLVGLPQKDLDRFLDWKDRIIRGHPGETPEEQREIRNAVAPEVYEYFTAALDDHRDGQHDDVICTLFTREIDGRPITDEEMLDILYLFLIAGLDTVTDSLDCFFVYLAKNPDQRARLMAEPEILKPAIEEMLRWETPVPGIARVALQDCEIAGETIKAGEGVSVLLGSANTDDDEFPDAMTVDLTRNPNAHRAFGGGPHRCLGSHLARLELRVALREFHSRISDYSVREGTVLEYTPGLRSVHSLPLVFTPSGG
jgi:cytochrome P450